MKAELLEALQREVIEGHTPGPWTVAANNRRVDGQPDGHIGPNVIADIAFAAPRTPEEKRANARLIADAPDLQSENAVLREAVQELAWGLRFFWHKNEDEVKERWEEAYALAHAIVEAAKETTDA